MYRFDELNDTCLKGEMSMYITLNVQSNMEIRSLLDLTKLKSLMENLNMKINKSQLARELGVDRRTIQKYLDGLHEEDQEIKAQRLMSIMKSLLHFYPQTVSKCSTTSECCGNT